MIGTTTVIRGDALHLPLPSSSVDLICTSPPYFGLRSYQDAGAHYTGQLGSEATPAEFLEALLAATREMVRVLKLSGSIFVNLGDKYSGYNTNGGRGRSLGGERSPQRVPIYGVPNKSLMGIPWRYAIRCIDDLGLILRAEIIWAKPNGLPESVTDRVRRSHEQWFHFTKAPRYFAAVDEIREPHDDKNRPNGWKGNDGVATRQTIPEKDGIARQTFDPKVREYNPLGKLPGSVWTVPTQPLEVPPELGVDHFAAYPMEWPRRLIQGWTPAGICVVCGEGRRPVAAAEYTDAGGPGNEKWNRVEQGSGDYAFGSFKPQEMRLGRANRSTTITGYSCGCPTFTYNCDHPRSGYYREYGTDRILCSEDGCNLGDIPDTTPAVVLDPFGGTGTTALVAKALGRHGVSIDLSSDYCRLAQWRCNNPQQLAAALQVEKPDVIPLGQLSLFEEAT